MGGIGFLRGTWWVLLTLLAACGSKPEARGRSEPPAPAFQAQGTEQGTPTTTGPDTPTTAADAGRSDDAGAQADVSCVHEGPPLLDPSLLEPCDLCPGAHCLSNDR